MVRRKPNRRASNPKAPREHFGFSNFRMGRKDKETLTLRPSRDMGGLLAIEEGFYGFVSLEHTYRGGVRDGDGRMLMQKFPGYVLGGAHLRTSRFPGRREWSERLRGHGAIWLRRTKQFFVPILDDDVAAVHAWLVPFLRETLAERRDQIATEVSHLRARAIRLSEAEKAAGATRGHRQTPIERLPNLVAVDDEAG